MEVLFILGSSKRLFPRNDSLERKTLTAGVLLAINVLGNSAPRGQGVIASTFFPLRIDTAEIVLAAFQDLRRFRRTRFSAFRRTVQVKKVP